MSRGISAGLLSALQATVLRPIFFVELEFTSSTLYLCTQSLNVSWNSQTWLGNGFIKEPLGDYQESNDGRAIGCRIVLDAYDAALTALLLTGLTQSKRGTVYFGALDSSGAVITDPERVFSGFFDSVEFNENGLSSEAVLRYEKEVLEFKRINEFRYTDQSQQALFSGDRGFEYASSVQDWSGFWGKAARPKKTRRRRVGRN